MASTSQYLDVRYRTPSGITLINFFVSFAHVSDKLECLSPHDTYTLVLYLQDRALSPIKW
jgi:hypothetical protein